MTSKQHILKIHPQPLADLLSGAKTAEVRRNDRDFQVGDTVALREVNPFNDVWTGRPYPVRTISHIQTGYGLPDGLCVLSYAQPFVPRNRLPGRLAMRAALPDVPGDMLDHGLFAALDAMMAAPPAAAHGDEAVRKDAARYQALRNTPEIFIGVAEGDDMVFLKSPDQLDQLADNAVAMRAQGDGGNDDA